MCEGFLVTYVNDSKNIDGCLTVFVPTTDKKTALLYVQVFFKKCIISCVSSAMFYDAISEIDMKKISDRRTEISEMLERWTLHEDK